jgi:hypothetical protein
MEYGIFHPSQSYSITIDTILTIGYSYNGISILSILYMGYCFFTMAVIESLLAQVLGHSDCLWHLHTPERSERSELAGEVFMRLARDRRSEGVLPKCQIFRVLIGFTRV